MDPPVIPDEFNDIIEFWYQDTRPMLVSQGHMSHRAASIGASLTPG
jgi:hypothetical protein